MAKHQVQTLRNVAFVGHHHSGKTALVDLMLHLGGVNTRVGSPDDGTSMLDTDEDEKERKHSISSALCHLDHMGHHLQIIDTPGMPDFVGQAISALRGVETAVVVVNAHGGIEVNTRKMFKQAENAGIARMIVINKLDTENINFEELVNSIRETFGPACALMNVPIGMGHDFSGVVDAVDLPAEIPAGVVMDPKVANQQVDDAAVEANEELMERYLEGEELSHEELAGAIRAAVIAGTLIPIYCLSVKSQVGVKEFMDGLAEYAPTIDSIPRSALRDGKKVSITADPSEPFVAQVIKTRIDPFVGRMNYIRVFSGEAKKDASVKIARTGKTLKLSQVFDVQGNHTDPLEAIVPGDIAAVVKAEDLRTGDTLTSSSDGLEMPEIVFPTPMIGLAVEPKSQADQAKISAALHKIEEEDPTFVVKRDAATKEMVMNGMSELHLMLVQHRLSKREKVEVVTHQPKIPYRETVNGDAQDFYRHKKQSGGSGQFGEVHFRISSCPQGINPEEYFTKDRFESLRAYHYDPKLNYCFVDRVSGGSVPNQFIPAVEKGIKERMEMGVIAGYQVQDVVVELFFGKDHPVDSNETAFKTAARMCFKKVFQMAKPSLLEPIVHIEIVIPSDKVGDITSDLNTRRGRMEGMDAAPGGFTTIRAHAPLSEVMTYARTLSSITGGQGSFSLEFSHYEMVPPNEQAKIVAAAKKEDEDED